MTTTAKTQQESYFNIRPATKNRQDIILEVLRHSTDGMTAREIANQLYYKGVTSLVERNFSSPRLTELCALGKVTTAGKRKCLETGRNVSVWVIKKED